VGDFEYFVVSQVIGCEEMKWWPYCAQLLL